MLRRIRGTKKTTTEIAQKSFLTFGGHHYFWSVQRDYLENYAVVRLRVIF